MYLGLVLVLALTVRNRVRVRARVGLETPRVRNAWVGKSQVTKCLFINGKRLNRPKHRSNGCAAGDHCWISQ